LSFRFKTIIGIALIESVLLLILILSVLGFLNTSHEKEMNQRAISTAKLFATMSKNAVLASDLASLEAFVSELLKNKDIVYARIIGDGVILAQGGNQSALTQQFKQDKSLARVIDGVFDVSSTIEESGYVYGRVELGLSIKRIQQVVGQAKQWSVGIALIEVTMVAIFSFILGTWLTRQLYQLKKASEIVAQQGPGHQVIVSGKDEVAKVAIAFNNMSTRLNTTYKELQNTTIAYRKAAEQASQSNAFNQSVLSSSLDGIVSIDNKGIIIEFNPAAEGIFGYKRNEAIGSLMVDLIVPEEFRTQHNNSFERYLSSGHSNILDQRIELKALHKNGTVFPIELTVSAIENNKVICFTGFIRDISEQENTRKELRLSAHAFEAHEGILICNNENKILRVNQAFTQITGYSANDIIGKSPNVFSSGYHNKQFFDDMWAVIKKKGRWEGEVYNKRKNGDIYPEWLGISTVKDKDGIVTYYVAHFIDISKRKEAENNLKQAIDEAEQANQAKSAFLATMSHEIRTPINAILGSIDLIKDFSLHKEQLKFLDLVDKSAKSLLNIINDILDFSKIEADKVEIENNPFLLPALIDEVLQMLTPKAQTQNTKLTSYINPEIPDILVSDVSRIKQVILNFLNNAVKFSKNGEVLISVLLEEKTAQYVNLRFEIKDTGIGIKYEDQKTLFDAFSQVENKSNRRFEGTGLGLAICSKLIRLLKGDLGVESELGKGSLFWFTLPLAIENRINDNVQQKQLSADKQVIVDNSVLKLHLLLAEDSEANISVATAVLKKAGHTIDVARNGKEAVEAVTQSATNDKPYDLILMDLMMPEMDGIEATGLIRAMDNQASCTPIVAMTANAIKGDRENCLNAGMTDYISKPFVAQELLDLIQVVVRESPCKEQNQHITQQSTETELPLLEKKVLEQLADDTSEELVPEMVGIFIKELNRRVEIIDKAIDSQNVADIGAEVHAIKSSAGTYGALKLQSLAKSIDALYKDGNKKQLLELSKKLPDLIRKTINIFDSYLISF